MIKALIFDLWGTIIENGVHPSPTKQVRYFLRTQIQFSEFITTFEDTFMTKEYDSLKDAFEAVVNDFNLKIPDFVYEKLIGTWNKNAILSQKYDETDDVLKALKEKGLKLFLLANIDKFAFDQVTQKHQLNELFDKVYPSYETGLLKLNPESYKKILDENGLKEDEVLMIGDCLLSDMESSKNAGIKGILVDRKERREYDDKIKDLSELSQKIDEMN